MYRSDYLEMASEGWQEHRHSEREVLLKSIALMDRAERSGMKTPEAVEAAVFVTRLWCHLIEDLGCADNVLAPELRAQLISIGLFLVKAADEIRSGTKDSFQPMIDITASIAEGLKG